MEEELARILQGCTLSEEELTKVTVLDDHIREGVERCKASLYAKVLSDREAPINMKGFAVAMGKSWRCENIKINKCGTNTFHIFLGSETEVQRALKNGPWSFDNYHVAMMAWEWGLEEEGLQFPSSWFWIQVTRLPFPMHTKEMALQIAEFFPGSEAMEIREETMDGVTKQYFRIRAKVNINKPLRRFVQLQFRGRVYNGVLAYERLPYMCLYCGHITHVVKNCPDPMPLTDKKKNLCFGLWMKAESEGSKLIKKVSLMPSPELEANSPETLTDSSNGSGSQLAMERVPESDNELPMHVQEPEPTTHVHCPGKTAPNGSKAEFSETLSFFGVSHTGGLTQDKIKSPAPNNVYASSNHNTRNKGKTIFPLAKSTPNVETQPNSPTLKTTNKILTPRTSVNTKHHTSQTETPSTSTNNTTLSRKRKTDSNTLPGSAKKAALSNDGLMSSPSTDQLARTAEQSRQAP